ncbi:MAG: hypothetical protein A2Y96_01650 [Firmicutes bacterium RBG_13_65_8]|nr:MAG: hypothetical protein A2Y96_01650 [Firmicutes bacterium RBG_13_65_8]
MLSVSFAGVGGQGIVLAGVVLGEAAVSAGLWACQSAAYTVAARGGFTRSEVLISASPLACPLAEEVDVVVALAGLGWEAECRRLRRGGLGLAELSEVDPAAGRGEVRVSLVPFARIAAEAGADRSANVVAVGVLAGLTGAVPREALLAAVHRHLGAARAAPAALVAGLETGAKLRETEGVTVEF